jgi:hypothetical protein
MIFQVVCSSCFIVPTLHCAGDARSDLHSVAANVVFDLIRAVLPSSPPSIGGFMAQRKYDLLSQTPFVLHVGH